MEYNLMTNAELKIHLIEYECEYQSLQSKVRECVEKMKTLDEKYLKVKKILEERNRGVI